MRLHRLLLVPASLAILLGAGALWLGHSESGLRAALNLASQASGGSLQFEEAHGTLAGPLQLDSLRWESPELQIEAQQVRLDWSPGALLRGTLAIAELTTASLHIVATPSSEPTPPPAQLRLPLSLAVERIGIAELRYGNAVSITDLNGRLHSDGRQHRLDALQARFGGILLNGSATLAGDVPLPLAASLELAGPLAEREMALHIDVEGPLERLAIKAEARAGIAGRAEAVLTPFAPAAFASLRVALDEIDPAAWQDGAPGALLSLRAELAPAGDGVAGSFKLDNARAGTLDRDRLPLLSLAGKVDWQDEIARLSGIRASLGAAGEITGNGEWRSDTLHLDLDTRQIDAARIVSSLLPTRLNGPLTAELSTNRQRVALDLRDARFGLRGDVEHATQAITLRQVELSADQARLALDGRLELGGERSFTASGELRRFDPSRFAKVPSAQINARIKSSGKLLPRPLLDLDFALNESQLAGQTLGGQGRLRLDWPRVPQADIQLAAGPNSLKAFGAFGRSGDLLTLDLDAPKLDAYGLEGGITGRIVLAGDSQSPSLDARLQAARFGLPGSFRLQGLDLKAHAGSAPQAPLLLDLTLGTVSTAAQGELLKSLHIDAEGSNQAHRIRAGATFATQDRLNLEATGGLVEGKDGTAWHGQLRQAALRSDETARNFRLEEAAELKLGRNAWSFGPARLAGDPLDWRASLALASDGRTLRASLNGRGTRIGQLDGTLEARLLDAWTLDRQGNWQGSLKTDSRDLAWLGELIGESWQTGGSFNSELRLSGTPEKPLASGRLQGEKLLIRQAEQGLHLANGALQVELESNLLRVRQLGFDSVLRPAPRNLRLAARDEMAKLTEQPGRLEVSGEMAISGAGAEHAFLDVRLSRLGVFQLPDQWVLLSGDGRLSWAGDTLGARGQLAVDAAYWQLAPGGAPRLSDDVVVKRPGDEAKKVSLRPKLDLDIATSLGRNFLFNGAGLSAKLGGDLRLRASGRDLPRASGTIRTRDGRFDAYGQQLEIERGILSFQGLLDNPALDVRAMRKGLAVEAGVQIGGTAQRPVVKLISDPELPDAEKLAWLVLGHGPDQMSAGDATLLLGAAGGLLGNDSGNLVGQLKKTFGIDEFGVRQGEIGGGGGRQPASRVAGSSVDTSSATGNQIFSVGKRLSSNAMLSYEQALGKAESIVKLTVSLNRQISVVGRAGSDNAFDIFYTLSFGKEPRTRR